MNRRTTPTALAGLAVSVTLVTVSASMLHHPPPVAGGAAAARTYAHHCGHPQRRVHDPFTGIAVRNSIPAHIRGFRQLTHLRPDVVAYYTRFGRPFDFTQACQIARRSVPLIQWNPRDVPLWKIIAGKYDRYLGRYATAVRQYGGPVIISFGHEMNGPWYSWSYTRTPARQYRRAWRHIWWLLKVWEAGNVAFMWNPNHEGRGIDSVRNWWPGDRYVDLVGLDGYYRTPVSSFAVTFQPTIGKIRAFTAKPLVIAETGIYPGPAAGAQIRDLFAGIRANFLSGVIWFDINAKLPWRLTKQTAREFRRGYHDQLGSRLASPHRAAPGG